MMGTSKGASMNREKVLLLSRMDNVGDDERDRSVREGGAQRALLTVALLAIVLDLAKSLFLHQPNGDLMAVAFLGMGVFSGYQYRRARRRELLGAALVWFVGSAWWAVGYLAAVGALPL